MPLLGGASALLQMPSFGQVDPGVGGRELCLVLQWRFSVVQKNAAVKFDVFIALAQPATTRDYARLSLPSSPKFTILHAYQYKSVLLYKLGLENKSWYMSIRVLTLL